MAMVLTHNEEVALGEACEHWAHLSFDPYDTSDLETAYNRVGVQVPPDYSRPTAEWEELENQDSHNINLAEVWSDGNRFLQEEALHEFLASNRPKDLEPSIMEDGVTMGGFLFEPVEVDATVLNVGQKYIHARCDYGDIYINPKLTAIVNTLGGQGAQIRVKVVKSADTVYFKSKTGEAYEAFPKQGDVTEVMYQGPEGWEMEVVNSAFPLKGINIIVPKEKQNVIVDVEVIKTSNHRGSRIHGGHRLDTNEKVWIDKFYTNIVFSKPTSIFKMKLVPCEGNYPFKAVFIWP